MNIKERFVGESFKNSISYKKDLNPQNPNDIALLLQDLDRMGYNIEGAIKRFKHTKKQGFPFW